MADRDEIKLVPIWAARQLVKACPPPVLRPEMVPEEYRRWIALAQRWGISDDTHRMDAVEGATSHELEELIEFLRVYEAVLDEWLASEAGAAELSPEYIAFSSLGMAAEHAELRFRRGGT